jgi:hypothetical protein
MGPTCRPVWGWGHPVPHGNPLGSASVIHLLESSIVFPRRFRHGFNIFLLRAPNIANNISFYRLNELFTMVYSNSSFGILLTMDNVNNL